ncbi:MAG TPA: Si-specific NAD(P)(+) transhydrogenase [Verrucomicrobiae bacterium]|nr:Si-specific NAD(P)(+) transhydrogenase [Verrucomicrobiae bacterium]
MTNETQAYDLVVIGGGPAGIAAATTAAGFGKRVVLVDNHADIGGAGINTGTVPSKTLRETALALSGIRSRNLYGVDLSVRREVTVADFLGHEQHVQDAFHKTITERLKGLNATICCGTCSFVDAYTVKVRIGEVPKDGPAAPAEEVLLRGEKILIATGSSPVRPAIFPFGQEGIYDSDTILKLERIPKTMAVIGAGVVGAEYACTFRALGAEVNLIDGREVLLPFLDGEVSRELAKALGNSGLILHWKETVLKCLPQASAVRLELASGAVLTADAVLVAAGRQSNTAKLELDKAGVKTGERGLIPVNDAFQTNIENIFAAGDVIGFPALASTSMEQARCAMRHAFGQGGGKLSPLLPNGIYTIPEASMVGETEESLKKKGIAYIVGRANYQDNARGRIIGDQDGFVKLLFAKDDQKLLGVHIMGELATEIVHIGMMAMLANAKAGMFIDACFNVPTLGGLYKTATMNALKQLGAPEKRG